MAPPGGGCPPAAAIGDGPCFGGQGRLEQWTCLSKRKDKLICQVLPLRWHEMQAFLA